MFVRAKKSGAYQYLQLVRSERVDGHVRQQVIATLGRLDVLQNAGRIDALIPGLEVTRPRPSKPPASLWGLRCASARS